jgi:HAE1 family hydrophobic/amphiphilic exporter-1
MKLTESAVKHPVTTTMLFAAMLLMGLISLSRLGLELFPDITFPTVVVYTTYPGVGPEEIEAGVTRPIENAVAALNGVKQITSTSSEGVTLIIVNFNWGTDMDNIVSEIREKIISVEDDASWIWIHWPS